MIRGINYLLLLVLLSAPPAFAQSLDQPLAQPLVEEVVMASVVTRYDGPEACLAPVAINRIDGEVVAVPAQGFSIEPGVHSLNGLATLDVTKCQAMATDLYIPRAADLEIGFEAGKTYFIAYDRSSPDTAEWKLVVWKTEQALTQ